MEEPIVQLPPWLEKGTAELITQDDPTYEEVQDLTLLPLEIEQQIIAKDMLYCLIGAEGQYIRCVDSKYVSKCIIRESTTSFVEQLIPTCNNFLIIRNYSEGKFSFEHGRIIHALCAAIRTVSHEFIQTIAKLESSRNLTLALLAANLQIPSQTLHQISSFILEIEGKRGCQLLSELDKHLAEYRGSPQSRKLFTFLFDSSCVPLLDFIQRWMNEGIVDDPFDEFFIVDRKGNENSVIDRDSFFWTKRFEIIDSKKPLFITPSAMNSIYLAGKAAAVIAECGLKKQKPTKITIQAIRRETLLESTALDASLRLVNALRDNYGLLKVIHSFKIVYLCVRADWLNNLFDVANATMSNDKNNIHIPTLCTHLEASLPKDVSGLFSPCMEGELFTDKIRSMYRKPRQREYQSIPRDGSWEYFNIVPKVDPPLSLVFNQTIVEKYQILFRMLLMWHRLDEILSVTWRDSYKVKQFAYKNALRSPLHSPKWKIDQQCHSMQIFVSNYIGYMMSLIIHPLWKVLEDSISTVSSFDSLLKLHSDTLDTAISGFFLSNEVIYNRMMSIATNIYLFIDGYNKFIRSIDETTTIREQLMLAKPLQTPSEAFRSEVVALINDLIKFSKSQSSLSSAKYEEFVYWININNHYIRTYADDY